MCKLFWLVICCAQEYYCFILHLETVLWIKGFRLHLLGSACSPAHAPMCFSLLCDACVVLVSTYTACCRGRHVTAVTVTHHNSKKCYTNVYRWIKAIIELGITVGMSLLKFKNKIVTCHHPFRKYSHKVASDQKTLKSVHN